MKKSILCGILVCLSMVAFAQRSMEWYAYWGSNDAGNQIEPQRMIVDNEGNIYVAALFGGTKVAVENKTLVSASPKDNGDAVIVKMSDAKVVQWVYPIVSAGNATISDIAFDKQGNIVAVGGFTSAIKVGNATMELDDSNLGEAALYVLKLKADGSAIKAWQISAAAVKTCGVAIDSQDNIIVAGTLDGDATFIPGQEAEGDFQKESQLFVAKFDANGNHVWHKFTNTSESSAVYGKTSVAVDENDNIYVATTLTGSMKIQDATVSASASNALLIAYNAAGEERWYHMIDGDQSDEAAAGAVSPMPRTTSWWCLTVTQ